MRTQGQPGSAGLGLGLLTSTSCPGYECHRLLTVPSFPPLEKSLAGFLLGARSRSRALGPAASARPKQAVYRPLSPVPGAEPSPLPQAPCWKT